MKTYGELFPSKTLGSYLDYAATAPVFLSVLDVMRNFEMKGRGNPRRGLHAHALHATEALEESRRVVADFVGADSSRLIFTKSATEALNIAITSFTSNLGPGDQVLHTVFDHNSAYLPLKREAERRGFSLVEATGVDFAIPSNVKLLVLTHVSNVTGEEMPISAIIAKAHARGVKVIVDGAQAVAHVRVNVELSGADAYAFSAHKMYGPMGIGALALSEEGMRALQPFVLGGGMTEPGVVMFEAGTPNVTGAVGFAEASRVLSEIGFDAIKAYDRSLMTALLKGFEDLDHKKYLLHHPSETSSILAFSVTGVHPHDVAQVLADRGVAVRAGHHCAPNISKALDKAGVVRVSVGLGADENDVHAFFEALKGVERLV